MQVSEKTHRDVRGGPRPHVHPQREDCSTSAVLGLTEILHAPPVALLVAGSLKQSTAYTATILKQYVASALMFWMLVED